MTNVLDAPRTRRTPLATTTRRCPSPLLDGWITTVMEAMPRPMLDPRDVHGARWHTAVRRAATADARYDAARLTPLISWMWQRLGGKHSPDWVPTGALPVWDAMLRTRTAQSARLAADAALTAAWENCDSQSGRPSSAASASWAANCAAIAVSADAPADAGPALAQVATWTAAAASAAGGSLSWIEHWRACDPALVLTTVV